MYLQTRQDDRQRRVFQATARQLAELGPKDWQGRRLVVIQHLLADTAAFVELLAASGADILEVLGIPYSGQNAVVQRIRSLGIAVYLPPWGQPEALTGRLAELLASGVDSELVLLDVGGYGAPIVSRSEAASARLTAVIEETAQGLWRYQAANRWNCPVISVADSRLKSAESVFIGDTVVTELWRLLRMKHGDLRFLRFLVLGVGRIGEAIAEGLRQRGAQVCCFDRDPVRRTLLRLRGYVTPERERALAWADVVIGASGQGSLMSEDLPLLRDGVTLASASSRQLEFPVEEILALARSISESEPGDKTIELSCGKTLRLLRDGFPLNFAGPSLPAAMSDLLFALLARALREGLQGLRPAGVHRLTDKEEEEVAVSWLAGHDELLGGAA